MQNRADLHYFKNQDKPPAGGLKLGNQVRYSVTALMLAATTCTVPVLLVATARRW